MKKTIMILLALAILAAPSAVAGEASPWTEADGYWETAIQKLDFGLKNFLGGWTEIFTEKMEAKEAGEPCYKGLFHGVKNAVVDTVGGALHTATFLIPVDVPLPEGGVSLGE